MALFPERQPRAPDGVVEVPEAPEIPPHIEKAGVQVAPTQSGVSITTDDKGQPVVAANKKQKIAITLPADEETLKNLSKGGFTDSITWWAAAWWRAIKKALYFGWEIVRKVKK